MQGNLLTSVRAVAVSATLGVLALAAAQTAPPIGGGYKDVIPIPVDDPATKTIAGALFKPAGSGPFPGVVLMTGCAGLNPPDEIAMQKAAIDHLLARGVATLLVDPFTPRNEPEGICANLNEKTFVQYATRGGNDVIAALKVLKAMPDIDPNRSLSARLFLGGDIVALRHGPKDSERARRQDRRPHCVLSLLL